MNSKPEIPTLFVGLRRGRLTQPTTTYEQILTPTLFRWLLAALLLAVLPHWNNLPWPVLAFFTALLAWRELALRQPHLLPTRGPLLLLTVGGAALALAYSHGVLGRTAGTSLFVVGLSLKLMELKTARDVYLSVFLSYLVAITQFLFSQSIPMAAYLLVVVLLLTGVLLGLNSREESLPARQRLRWAGALMLQSLPLMVLMFLLFPRIPGPLWSLPDEEKRGRTGLSDTLEPGAFSRLSLVDETAFRVNFEGEPPPPQQLYWRGPVFWQTDGLRWTLPQYPAGAKTAEVAFTGAAVNYTVILEPHQQKWLLALDLPARFPADTVQTPDLHLLARDQVTARKLYAVTSYPSYHTGPIGTEEQRLGLQLPGRPGPEIKKLVESWLLDARSDAEIVDRSLKHFHDEPFVYTLNPPPLGGHPVEQFLFETRRGFCEHYATAFVMLMRIAGIPARIVTGYLGGHWNPVGRFMEVKQADAHAWAEVWLDGKGWTRVDPTAAVAPERVERGLDLDSQFAGREIAFARPAAELAAAVWRYRDLWKSVRNGWASVDHAWQRWVLGYTTDSQNRLLEWLGLADWRRLGLWLAAGVTAIGVLLSVFLLRRREPPADPALRLYRLYCRKLERLGLSRRASEGPLDFAARVAAERPELAASAQAVAALYSRARYGAEGMDARLLGGLRQRIEGLPAH
ncbi:MAG TPA: DUF3488 and transglutaminase-like domain-containing protein [Methylococcaceae bacterium]|nr:DUF3488 and transglutaminase-like domain-containing protein [Methylococcaceae bacterium]